MAVLFLPAAGAWAQTAGGAAPSGQMKIAILNVRQAIVTTARRKASLRAASDPVRRATKRSAEYAEADSGFAESAQQ